MQEVGDPAAELAVDRSELFLTPAAQGLDGEPPADGELVFVEGDAHGTAGVGSEGIPTCLGCWNLGLHFDVPPR